MTDEIPEHVIQACITALCGSECMTLRDKVLAVIGVYEDAGRADLGARLRSERKKRRFTLGEFARAFDISVPTLSAMELGKRRLSDELREWLSENESPAELSGGNHG